MDKLFHLAKKVCNEANEFFNQISSSVDPKIINHKSKDHPVFNFDIKLEKFIKQKLIKTNYQIISEESFKKENLENEFWLIDPIDGSKDLLNNKKSTINISFVKNGYPVFGVINDIFLNQQYSGFVNKVDYKIFFGAHNTLNNNLKIITSRLHLNINDKKFIDINKFKQIYSVSSSMKFIGISESEYDLYSRFRMSGWDTCAGQAILEANGGAVIDLNNLKRLRYNKQNLRNPPFLALRNNLRINSFNKDTLEIKLHEINNTCCW